MNKIEGIKYGNVIIGGVIFALGVNLFIVPLNLFSGGVIGFAQMLRSILNQHFALNVQFDLAGIINLLLNIPLFILAYRSISSRFFVKTLCTVIAQTIALSLFFIPRTPILDDVLAASLIGGLICGFGIGLALRNGGSGGGIDILGVYMSQKFGNFSVGKLSMIVNAALYILCAVLFNIETAIYSILYTACMYLVVDRVHYQNINMSVMILTKQKDIQKLILHDMRRGVTYWKGQGAYTDEDTYILMSIISKYEVSHLQRLVLQKDPKAFIIFNEGMHVKGNFEKRL